MAELQPNDDADLTKADASPTKAFFVDIITRDILLDEAIQDLLDNCVDGAKRLNPGDDSSFNGLWVRLEVGPDKFEIADNCGGIPLDVARKYAFKFGRAAGFKPTSHSVGQFGVGMKRALFKMGGRFSVSSVEPESRFTIAVDVEAWAQDDRHWDFDITGLVQAPNPVAETGTVLKVEDLEVGVAETFKQETFVKALRNQIRVTQQHPMARGLQISLNGEAIIPLGWQLIEGEGLAPMFKRFEDDLGGTDKLKTRLYSGIGESSSALAGWYIFCNGRCILDADQSDVTGWTITSDNVAIPKYHGQFARFRGYAFLDSDDAEILPWNTTKTGLDLDSAAYRRLSGRLVDATRPVIDFLNSLDAEQDFEKNDQVLTAAVAKAPQVALEKLVERPVFQYTPPPRRGPALARISYKRPQAEVDKLKDEFNVSSNKEVGERSFEFAFERLVDES
jgi:hypothetical protein